LTLDLAYREGKPVERQVNINANAMDFPKLVERLNQSPAYLEDELSEQKTVEAKQSTPSSAQPS
jgi:hypothetical protein